MAADSEVAPTVHDQHLRQWSRALYAVASVTAIVVSGVSLLAHSRSPSSTTVELLTLVGQDIALLFFGALNMQSATNAIIQSPFLLHGANVAGVIYRSLLVIIEPSTTNVLALVVVVLVSGLAWFVVPIRGVRFRSRDT